MVSLNHMGKRLKVLKATSWNPKQYSFPSLSSLPHVILKRIEESIFCKKSCSNSLLKIMSKKC